ncbi:MAG TPA: hypothetical protein VKD90_20155 [Gemmataceae bacterium]|nr:hypothetical protein [Gemmataceae bacterium]
MLRPSLAAFFAGILVAAAPAAAADPPVSGKFIGNGKEAKLEFVTAQKGQPYLDKPTTKLIFTEKDHSKDKRPDIAAGFGDYGSALIITVKEDGKIIGCVIAHSAHEKKGINSVGSIAMSDYKVADGKVTGKIKTNGMVNTFGEKWQVDIQFEAKAP